jgi:hypothetical protein
MTGIVDRRMGDDALLAFIQADVNQSVVGAFQLLLP